MTIKYLKTISLEDLVSKVVNDFVEYNEKYNYRIGATRENAEYIISSLVDEYSSLYSEDEELDFDLENQLWEELRYNYSFGLGVEKINELFKDFFYEEIRSYAIESLAYDLEEFNLNDENISEDIINKRIENLLSSDELISDDFLQEINWEDYRCNIYNINDPKKCFLVVREIN
ncbi:hypothetical protein [Campylobacter sp. MG1]|uniref:hypothetical protein n=1 Tax=Campylobacter sp. MG1 TaxID=2976332 RepID=UPI00226C778C|nr:hypothetical protein [Campylobacter sp. MG1]